MSKNIINHIPQHLLTLVGFILLLSSSAQAQEFEGKNISSVSIRYNGPRTVNEARLRGYMSVKSGQKYSASRLDDDVRSLYESGLVDDVRFFAKGSGNSVRVTAEITTRGRIVTIKFYGNSKFTDKKLVSVSKMKVGGVMSDESILTARRQILDHYRAYGYADVTIGHDIQPSTKHPDTSDLIFRINEGVRSEVRKIRFKGNHSIPSHKLRNEMKTKQKGWFSFFTKSGRIDTVKLDEDIDRVLDYYRNRGFLYADLTIHRSPLKDGRLDLVLSIKEGNKYSVAQVGFGKMKIFTPAQLGQALTLTAGQPYSAKKMNKDITTIRSYYGSRGYADAAVSPDIRAVTKTSVSITYRVSEGRRYKVGRVTIEGNDKSQDRVIRRELALKPDDYFNSVEMETTKRRLRNMNYFNDVQVSGSPSKQKGYRDIDIFVNEKQTGSVSFGVGFSSVDNIVGYVTLEQTNFDIKGWPTFTGAGQRFSSKIQYGAQRKDLSVNWTEPWFLGQRLALGTEFFYRSALYYSSEYEQGQFGGAVSLRKPFGNKSYIKAQYRIEKIDIDVDSDNIGVGSKFEQYDGKYLRSALGFHYVYDSRDSNQLPRKGHKVDAGIEYVGLGGDVDAFIYTLEGSKYWNLWADSIFSIKGNFYIADGDEIEIFDKKSLGGAHSLRGFDNRNVGPRDNHTNEVIGGNTAAYLTMEYTFPLIERVRGAVFYDVGLVNEDSWDFDANLYHDAGLGLRLNLPFGPLAIDYGFPLKSYDEKADEGGQFSFYLDYAF